MFKMDKFLSMFFLSCVCSFAHAGSTTSKILYIQTNAKTATPNVAAIKFVTPPSQRAGCASDDRMILNLETEGGKAAFSIALAAKTAGLAINAAGNGDCTGALENVGYLRFQ
jgi:hypothetical protein